MDGSIPGVYDGQEPFVFCSYAHDDSETVFSIIEELKGHGYRIWYDAGIEAGSEWPEYLAEKLEACSCFVAFISNASTESYNCKREINYAIELNKSMLIVYLEDVSLTSGMRMQLNPIQALFRSKSRDDRQFMESLARAKVLEACKAKTPHETNHSTKTIATDDTTKKGGKETDSGGGPVQPPKPKPDIKTLIAIATIPIVAILCAIFLLPRPSIPDTPDPGNVSTEEGRSEQVAHTRVTTGASGGVLKADTAMELDDESVAKKAVFGSAYARDQISSVTFSASIPEERRDSGFDVSESGDGSVLAWFDKGPDGLYDLLIASDGKVVAPKDCSRMFMSYTNARSFDFGGAFDTSGALDLTDMFKCCKSLVTLDISSFDTSLVTSMAVMFSRCTSLKTVDLTNIDTSHVMSMMSMFFGDENLQSVDVSNFKTSHVDNMHAMFYDCSSLKKLDVSGFVTDNVRFMSSMFDGCSSLKELDVSGFDTSSVHDINSMFSRCIGISSLDLSAWDISKVNDHKNMFANLSSSLEVQYPKDDEAWANLVASDDLGGSPTFVAAGRRGQ